MRSLALCLSLSVAMTAMLPQAAMAREGQGAFVPVGAVADAPLGYLDMCRRDPALCGAMEGRSVASVLAGLDVVPRHARSALDGAGTAATDPARLWARASGPEPVRFAAPQGLALDRRMLGDFSNRVNRHILQRTDYEIYGVAERWARPVGRDRPVGDCEDIAIEKRAELVEAGADPRSLALAVVYSHQWGLHTVLVAHLDAGDYVLDSLSARLRRWDETGYAWLRIQSRDNPGEWRAIGA